MGIHKLNKEIFYNKKLWTTKLPTKNIVIDGNSLMYHIWQNDKFHKYALINDMEKYKVLLQEFIMTLRLLGFIINIVVMDGTTNKLKIPSFIKRQQKKQKSIQKILRFIDNGISIQLMTDDINGLIHPFIRHIFVTTFKELNIPIINAFEEADSTVIYMAQKFKSIVVATDSDYYFSNIIGYIPLKIFNKKEIKMYSVHKFINEYNISPHKLHLIGKLLGDDFHDPVIDGYEKNRLNKALEMIKNNKITLNPMTLPAKHQKDGLLGTCVNTNIVEALDIEYKDIKNVLSTELLTKYIQCELEPRIVNILISDTFFMSCDCEDISKDPSILAGRLIRMFMYFLMNKNRVIEVIMKNNEFVFDQVDVTSILNVPNPINQYPKYTLQDNIFINTCRMLLPTDKINNIELMAFIYAYINQSKVISLHKIKISRRSLHLMAKYRNILYSIFIYYQWTKQEIELSIDTISLKNFHYYLDNPWEINKSDKPSQSDQSDQSDQSYQYDKINNFIACIIQNNEYLTYIDMPTKPNTNNELPNKYNHKLINYKNKQSNKFKKCSNNNNNIAFNNICYINNPYDILMTYNI